VILTRLQTLNWGCLGSIDIRFSEGVTGILGPNGSGKSTLLDAIRFAVTGESVASGPRAENITMGERTGSVTLAFTHGDSGYEVKRVLEPSRQQLKFPGGTLGRQSEIEEKLTLLLGTRMDALLNNVFIGQHAIDDILFKTNTERLREFQDTFGLSKAAEVYKLLSTEISSLSVTTGLEQQLQVTAQACQDVTREVGEFREQLRVVENELLELSKFEERLRHYRIAQQSASARQQTEEALSLAQQRYIEADKVLGLARDAYTIIMQRFTAMQPLVAEQVKDLDQAKASAAQRRLLLSEQFNLTANKVLPQAELGIYDEQISKLTETRSKLKAIMAKEAPLPQTQEDKDLAQKLEGLKQQLSELKRDDPSLALIEADIHRIKHELATFAGGQCPTCHRPIENFDDAELKRQAQVKQVEIAKIKSDQSLRVAAAQKDLAELSKQLEDRRRAAMTAVVNMVDSTITQLEKLVSSKNALTSQWENYNRCSTRLVAVNAQLATIPDVSADKIESLQKSIDQFKELSDQVSKSESEVRIKQAAQASCASEVARLKDLLLKVSDSKFELSSEELQEAQQKMELLSARTQTRTELTTKIGITDAKLIQLRSSVDQLKKQYDHERNAAKWSSLCSRAREVVHVNGLPALMMREYANRINKRMAHYMEIWEAPFQFYLDADLSFRAKFSNGFELPAHRLSGGQKIVASTSFRLAMSDTFARSVGLLILDEPTNHLDESNVVHLQQLLLKLKQFSGSTGRQILIVTHAESLTSFFDQTIKLAKKE